jgi:hypothetical protein
VGAALGHPLFQENGRPVAAAACGFRFGVGSDKVAAEDLVAIDASCRAVRAD